MSLVRIKYASTGITVSIPSLRMRWDLETMDKQRKTELAHSLARWKKSGFKGYPQV